MPTLDTLQWIIKDNNNIIAESTTNSKPWILFDPDQGQKFYKNLKIVYEKYIILWPTLFLLSFYLSANFMK